MIWFLIVLDCSIPIMFPVLFATGIHQSGHASCFDGAVLIMAISGGALIPALARSVFNGPGNKAIAPHTRLVLYHHFVRQDITSLKNSSAKA